MIDLTRLLGRYEVCPTARSGLSRNGRPLAGSIDPYGYVQMDTPVGRVLAHRLVHFVTTGQQPPTVDHKDLNKLNNRPDNLRAATRSEQCINRPVWGKHAKGVHWNARLGKFAAAIQRNRKRTHLGYFKTEAEASQAYQDAAKAMHGEFQCDA